MNKPCCTGIYREVIHRKGNFLWKIAEKRKNAGLASSLVDKWFGYAIMAKRGVMDVLQVAEKLSQLRFSLLMDVYEEGNRENGRQMYPGLPENEQLLRAEASFYAYLTESFFKTPGAVYAMWTEQGQYVCALRLEPYQDGHLLEALETKPDHRNRGCAAALMKAVLERWPGKIYSHVSKGNMASLAVHEKCGFQKILDHAVYIDGSVARNPWTLCAPERGKAAQNGKNY